MVDDRDRRRYREEAKTLLARRPWTADDLDYAVRLHDLLEAPEDSPDPVARQLRARLTGELDRYLTATDDPTYRVRRSFFSLPLLDTTDAFERRLFLLLYRGITNFLGYESGARGQLNAAVEAYMELDRIVQAEGARASAILKDTYHSALLGLATACYTRYSDRRELLQAAPATDVEREIRADLDRAVAASERAADGSSPTTRASALAVLGSCYACRFEDDVDFNSPETINTAVNFLREAVQLAEAVFRDSGGALESAYNLRGIRDRLAGALATRDTVPDVDEAIALYTRNREEMPSLARDITAGEAVSLAVAWIRRWLLTGETADRERAREAYTEAFASGEAEHLPAAFTISSQWGGLAWQERQWSEAGAAYQQATRVMHLAVRQQGSRADREWVVKKAPGVAARAALGLARAGALDDALITLETGRAVLLTEMFDRRALDYQRVVSLAGDATANDYQRLTDELTRLEAQLVLTGREGNPAITAAIEETRKQRSALWARMPSAARNALSEMDGPPTMPELRRAAAPATVVYLSATGEGGLALILRPDGAPVEPVELESLTMAAAMELVSGLEFAIDAADVNVCADVCEQLWLLAMERLLPRLQDVAEVVLIPGGALAGLPWHAAKLPGRSTGHVLDQIAVSYMPNARALPVARAAWQSMPSSLRALAIEAPEPTSAPVLPTADEIAAVQACHSAEFRVIWLPGAEATRPQLRRALSQFEVLHFAGHARADPDPLAGGLLLAQDECLTIRELLASGIGAARFAVLSACDTARVEDLMSDEMVSFPTALMQCGFGGVIGSLWAASDRPTTMLMKAFYREWRGNATSPRQALRAAQQWTRDRRYASPLAWANFVYVGP